MKSCTSLKRNVISRPIAVMLNGLVQLRDDNTYIQRVKLAKIYNI